ncbi:phage tail tape measure protein [Bradyrhizobium sp. 25ACV]
MPAPSLSIPIKLNLDQLKEQLRQTTSLTGNATRQIAKQFLDMNKDLAKDAIFATMARGAVDLAGKVALAVGAYKLMTAAISGAREQMAQMVEIANKAQNRGVSPAFLQAFTSEARKLKVEAGELESALDHAFQATKDRSPIDIGEWSVGEEKITDVEKALRVYNETLAKTAGQQLQGLVLFRDAQTQEDKVKAVLAAMVQLDSIGQHAASLDLGEKMFGAQIVDRMRQGKTSAEGMLQTIKEASASADGIFSNVLVERAKEVDDQLKIAHQRLSTALKPSWDDLASVMMDIKGAWADVIGYIAKAVELSNKLPRIPGMPASATDLDAKRDALAQVNARLNGIGGGLLGSVNLPPLSIPGIGQVYAGTTADLEAHRDRLQKEIAALTAGQDQSGPAVPGQSRGTGPAPTKISTGSNVDKLGSAADSIEKRIAALQAEAAGLDLTTAARERSKVAAQLETVAMQANAAAGKGEGVVTAEQRQRIEEVTEAYGKATEAIEKATVAQSIRRGRQTSLLDPQDVQIAEQLKGLYPDVATALNSVEASAMRTNEAMRSVGSAMSSSLTSGLADILDGTKSVAAGFADMSRAVVRALEEAMIKMLIVQPIMRALSSGMGFSDGGLVGPALAKAEGGYISGPGSSTSDSIPARLSNGEFVVRASATAKHRAVLEAINSDRIPRFADGGLVGNAGSGGAPMIAPSNVIAPQIAVTVQGSPGMSDQDHQRTGENVARSIEHQVRSMIANELRTQRRPGGVLR